MIASSPARVSVMSLSSQSIIDEINAGIAQA